MPNNSIETWTREECEEYLKHYHKSLKSDAVRKRLRALTPQPPQPQRPQETPLVGNNINVVDVVGAVMQMKEEAEHSSKNPTSQPSSKSKQTMAVQQKSEHNDLDKERKREEVRETVNSVWIGVKKVLKYGGLVCCVGLAIYILYLAITTGKKIPWRGGGFLSLMYAINRLSEWDVEK